MKRLAPLLSLVSCLALVGCVDTASYNRDNVHIHERLNDQSHRLYQVERDMIQLKRGYTLVPVKVMITNRTEVVR